MQYSYLPPIHQVDVATLHETIIEHYLELIKKSNCKKTIIFLFGCILQFLNISTEKQQQELLSLTIKQKPCLKLS